MPTTLRACALFLCLLLPQAQLHASPESLPEHLEHFGFLLVEVAWDDPKDNSTQTSYTQEVAPFSTCADVLVVSPTQDIGAPLKRLKRAKLGALLHLNALFFEVEPGRKAPSGNPAYKLRADYEARWASFSNTNRLEQGQADLVALYIGEEPTWNGIPSKDLQRACDLLKKSLPKVPLFLVEAYPALDALKVPSTVDWIGFDHYFLPQGAKAKIFRRELALLKSKRSREGQRIVLIPDANFLPEVHGHYGITKADLVEIAKTYLDLAQEDPDVVGVLPYVWPSGFDHPDAVGVRHMPALREAYRKFGEALRAKAQRAR